MAEKLYVICRTLHEAELTWLAEESWDSWVVGMPDRQAREVSRGHTMVEAFNLSQLANRQNELEKTK